MSRSTPFARWAWPVAIAAALIYTACFASFISRHTSLPFWDGYVYVLKTSQIAQRFHEASFLQRLNPALYFDAAQSERPPLLLAAAAIALGPNPGNASIAYVWMIVRVGVILLALYLLSREFGTVAFVPAAALVIFGSPLMCNFFRLYFMDEPFAAFGLLAFTLILIDDRRQTLGSAAAASLGILALFLVKPVAPAFVFPFCVVRAVRALLPLRQDWPNVRPQLRRLTTWAIPYLLLLVAMLALLYATPYGPGIREQYKLGSTGYWHKQLSAGMLFQLISFVLPLWLSLLLLATLFFFRRFQHKAVLLYLTGGLIWWLLFSFVLTYTVEDRLVGQAMPYVVTAILLWTCQRSALTWVVTAAAGFFFVCNTLVANGRITPDSTAKSVRLLSPVPDYARPVPEVGLLPFAQQLDAAIGSDTPTVALAAFSDIYVVPGSLNMALQMSTQPPRVTVRVIPKNPENFDLVQFCRTKWFITKTHRPNSGARGTGMWTTMNCVHALITHPESPLHGYFRKILEAPIHQPDLEDTLVLWQLSPPPDSAIAQSLRWLKPRLTNDPPAFLSAIDAQLRTLKSR